MLGILRAALRLGDLKGVLAASRKASVYARDMVAGMRGFGSSAPGFTRGGIPADVLSAMRTPSGRYVNAAESGMTARGIPGNVLDSMRAPVGRYENASSGVPIFDPSEGFRVWDTYGGVPVSYGGVPPWQGRGVPPSSFRVGFPSGNVVVPQSSLRQMRDWSRQSWYDEAKAADDAKLARQIEYFRDKDTYSPF